MTLMVTHYLNQKLLLPILISLQINSKHNHYLVFVSSVFNDINHLCVLGIVSDGSTHETDNHSSEHRESLSPTHHHIIMK